MNRHYLTHPEFTADCFACKVATMQFSPTTSPQSAMESRWERDMPAYYRLRMNGVQPKHIDGSAELETRASSQLEIEMGTLFTKAELPHALEGMEIAKEIRENMFEKGESTLVRPTVD